MDALLSTLEIILPIAATLLLGVYARRTGMMSGDAAGGMQRYAIRFGLPCVMFTACLTGDLSSPDGMNLGGDVGLTGGQEPLTQ